MKNKISLLQVSQKFKSIKDTPKWMRHGVSVFSQIRLIRRALGMTQEQLARRINGNQGDIAQIEKEGEKDVHVSTLAKIARALNCELLISFVPKKEILALVEKKSFVQAKKIITASSGNMAMELQKPPAAIVREQVSEMKEEILRKRRSLLWEENET